MLPVLYQLGPITIYTYPACEVLGIFLFYLVFARQARSLEIDEDEITNLFLLALIGGTAGARLLHVLLNYSHFAKDPFSILKLWQGGFSVLGGGSAGILVIFLYCRSIKLNHLLIFDCFSMAAPILIGIGRLGCLGFGCCYGKPSSLPWAIKFTNTINDVPRHPTQLYSTIFFFFFLALLLTRIGQKKHTPGLLTTYFVGSYALYRFFLEFIREQRTVPLPILSLTVGQIFSVIIFIAALAAWRTLGSTVTPAGTGGQRTQNRKKRR